MSLDVYMIYEAWVENFKPVENHFDPSQGIRFETYGREAEYVQELAQTTNRVWTEFDNGEICEGWHFVNRSCYYVTEVEFDPNSFYFVTDPEIENDEWEDDENA